MSRKPTIALPPARSAPTTADAFVAAGQPEPVPQEPEAPKKPKDKRLTIDIPPDLHHQFKLAAVAAGRDMREVMIDLITGYVAGNH